MTLSFCLRFGCDYIGGNGCLWVCQKTEDWLGCPLLVDGSVCVGGGPLITLFVMGCLWCVAERGCGAGVVKMGKVCWVLAFAEFGGISS